MGQSLGIFGGMLLIASASADQAEPVNLYSLHADPAIAIAAVKAPPEAIAGQSVRLSVYDNEPEFLETVATKLEAPVNADGLAVLPLDELAPGEYAFVAYLDENGDGKLNRGSILGRPKEPVAFSNGVKPRLKKPSFDETKVVVGPGRVVVIELDD